MRRRRLPVARTLVPSERSPEAFMQVEAFGRIDLCFLWGIRKNTARIAITNRPAAADALSAEVDVLGVVLAFEGGARSRTTCMRVRHPYAAISRTRLVSHSPSGKYGELGDDVPQAVNLLLPSNVANGAARILNVFLAVQNLPDRLWFWSARIPHMDREHQRVAAGLVVEYRLHWGVR
jgi:hypothetical protein